MHSDYLQFQYNDLQHSNFQFQHEGHATHVQIFRICKVYNMRIIHTLSNNCLHITDLCHLAAYICFSVTGGALTTVTAVTVPELRR